VNIESWIPNVCVTSNDPTSLILSFPTNGIPTNGIMLLLRVNDYSVSDRAFPFEITRDESLEMRSRHVFRIRTRFRGAAAFVVSNLGRARIKSRLCVPCPSGPFRSSFRNLEPRRRASDSYSQMRTHRRHRTQARRGGNAHAINSPQAPLRS